MPTEDLHEISSLKAETKFETVICRKSLWNFMSYGEVLYDYDREWHYCQFYNWNIRHYDNAINFPVNLVSSASRIKILLDLEKKIDLKKASLLVVNNEHDEAPIPYQGTKIFQYCTCPAGRVTYNFHSSRKHIHLSFKSVCNKEHKGVICNMTHSSNSSQFFSS